MDELQIEVKWQRTQGAKQDLLKDNTAIEMQNFDSLSAPQQLVYGSKLQQESKESLQQALINANEAQNIGVEVAAKLHAQTEQIAGVNDTLYEIEGQLDRAVAIVKRMLRRTATDKYMWYVLILVLTWSRRYASIFQIPC